jgi:hypothetical protein
VWEGGQEKGRRLGVGGRIGEAWKSRWRKLIPRIRKVAQSDSKPSESPSHHHGIAREISISLHHLGVNRIYKCH